MEIDGQLSLLSQAAFCHPSQTIKVHSTGSLGPVNGINKDVSDTRLLLTTVLTYPMNWVCFCHLLKTQHCSAVCEKHIKRYKIIGRPRIMPTRYSVVQKLSNKQSGSVIFRPVRLITVIERRYQHWWSYRLPTQLIEYCLGLNLAWPVMKSFRWPWLEMHQFCRYDFLEKIEA